MTRACTHIHSLLVSLCQLEISRPAHVTLLCAAWVAAGDPEATPPLCTQKRSSCSEHSPGHGLGLAWVAHRCCQFECDWALRYMQMFQLPGAKLLVLRGCKLIQRMCIKGGTKGVLRKLDRILGRGGCKSLSGAELPLWLAMRPLPCTCSAITTCCLTLNLNIQSFELHQSVPFRKLVASDILL